MTLATTAPVLPRPASPLLLFGVSVVGCAVWAMSFKLVDASVAADLARLVVIAATGAWLTLILAVHAVANTPAQHGSLLRIAARTCVMGSVVLAANAAINITAAIAGVGAGAPLIIVHVGGLFLANVVMAACFFSTDNADSGWRLRLRLWALLNLTFVLILAVVVAGGGW